MSDELTERLALLQEHQQAFRDGRDPFYCTCNQWVAVVVADGCDGNGVTIGDQHLAHLADVISDWQAGRIAQQRREGAAHALDEAAGAYMPDLSAGARRWLRGRAAALRGDA